jgi:hypothetical protein
MAEYTHDEKMDFLYEFAKRYQSYWPDAKDNMRASDCLKRPNPVRAAQAQLKRIEDRDKFYRRLKAFLQHGIKIYSFENTQWEKLESYELTQWLKQAVDIYAGHNSMSIKDKEITKLAEALTF